MFTALLIALAPGPMAVPVMSTPIIPRDMPFIREPRVAGVTPGENHTLSQPHPNSDDRMFPDIAIKDLKIDGDTLYVRLANLGRGGARVPILLAARAMAGGVKSDVAQIRTNRLAAGETRWVPIKGFSVKTAATAPSVFALANATAVSAAARLVPSSAGTLDRSGQGCGDCTSEIDETNNVLTLSGEALKRGKPQ
jgi:hypothetical protein